MAALREIKVLPKTYELLESYAKSRDESVEQFVEFLVNEFDRAREREFIERLRAEGMIVTFPPSKLKIPRNFKPVPVKGKPVSEIIIEDREPK